MFGSAEPDGMTTRDTLGNSAAQDHQPTTIAGVPGGSPAIARSARSGPADQPHDFQTLFDDGKAPDALRTIGEVTRALSIAAHVLRYWEDQFPMLRPVKRSGGRRYYRPEDVALLVDINRLVHTQGYTLRGARQYLEERAVQARREPSVPPPAPLPVVAPPVQGQLALSMPQDDLLDALIGLRGDLARLLGEE